MSSIDDQKPSFTAIEAVKLIEGASGDPNSIEVLKQLIEVMMQSYELALDYYRSGFENCTDKMGFPERLTYLGDHNPVSEKPAVAFSMSKVEECWKRRPKLSVEALRSSKMEQLEPWSKALVTFVEMEHWLSTENSAFDVQTFERVELHRWLMAKGIASNYVFSEGKDLSAASVGSGLQANSRKALTTAQIARVFDGIRWSAEAWRKPLGCGGLI